MSESFSDYSPDRSPVGKGLLPIKEIFEINKGNSGDWGIEGYKISKRPQLLVVKENLFPKGKRTDTFSLSLPRAKDPDPTKYSPTFEAMANKYWKPNNGKFTKDKKNSYIDEAIKISPRTPGPGTYFSLEKGKPEPVKKCQLGKMDKGEILNFLSTTECHAEESPSPGQYFTNDQDRDKAYSKRERKSPVFRYYTQKVHKREEKSIVGPGYLENLEKNMMKEGKKAKIYSAFFSKSKAPNAIEQGAIRSKFVPGVGFYKNVDNAYTQHIVIPKDRFTKISNSAFSRYSDMAAKSKSWVPGPGAYEILPPMRKNK